jgi:cardiolipin synthase
MLDDALDVVQLAGLAMTPRGGRTRDRGQRRAHAPRRRRELSAWRAAIAAAQRTVLFECYIFADDALGRSFAACWPSGARAGVKVCVVVDWLGSWNALGMWAELREAGGDVRVFNPPALASPLGWLSRDHRKTIVVDGAVGFVSGLCVSQRWVGDPAQKLEPWRDTGIEVRGPAVAALETAFAQVFRRAARSCRRRSSRSSTPSPARRRAHARDRQRAQRRGHVPHGSHRRVDRAAQPVAHRRVLRRHHALCAGAVCAARATAWTCACSCPVRATFPRCRRCRGRNTGRCSRRSVRVFEWNGTMLHAKTAVADGLWARVGSTNLNLASWMSNYELDVAIENKEFAEIMAAQYERDPQRATEIVLTTRNRVRRATAASERWRILHRAAHVAPCPAVPAAPPRVR